MCNFHTTIFFREGRATTQKLMIKYNITIDISIKKNLQIILKSAIQPNIQTQRVTGYYFESIIRPTKKNTHKQKTIRILAHLSSPRCGFNRPNARNLVGWSLSLQILLCPVAGVLAVSLAIRGIYQVNGIIAFIILLGQPQWRCCPTKRFGLTRR